MNAVEEMLTGNMEMREFIDLLMNNEDLQIYVKTLIPPDAIGCPQHNMWRDISYESLKKNEFDVLKFLKWICRFDNTLGDNLDIWGTLARIYKYVNPDVKCTTKYKDEYDLYLDIAGDYYEGPEVSDIIEKIIRDMINITPKTKRKQLAKEKINEVFHVVDKKRPRWVQSAEWPCGVDSPMQFVGQKRKGEEVTYTFNDVTTGDIREIVQYY